MSGRGCGLARGLAAFVALTVAAPVVHGEHLALAPLAATAREWSLDLQVSATDYPGDRAVLLLDHHEHMFDDRGRQTTTVHRLIKVLRGRAMGESVGRVRIVVPAGGQLQVVARTHASRRVFRVAASDIHRGTVRSRDPLSRSAEIVSFAFPGIEEGAILEVAYRIEGLSAASADVHVFDDHLPVQVAAFGIGYPKKRRLTVHVGQGFAETAPERDRHQRWLRGRVAVNLDRYVFRDLPAVPAEPFAHQVLAERTHLLLVLGGDADRRNDSLWTALASAIMRAQEGPRFSFSEPRAVAQRVARRHSLPEDTAMAIVRGLSKKLRLERFGEVSERPRTLDEVYESGVAEPMEFARILVAMLRAAGVDAYLGLVNSADNLDFDPRIPWSGFFDRWLVVAYGRNRDLYFDLDAPNLLAGVPRADCQGRTMLLSKWDPGGRASARLTTVPRTAAGDNTVRRRAVARLSADGSARLQIEVSRTGEPAWELRDAAIAGGDRYADRLASSELARALSDADPASAVLTLSESGAAVLKADVETHALALRGPDGVYLTPGVLGTWRDLAILHVESPLARAHGVNLRYPRRLETTVDLELASGMSLGPLPSDRHVPGPGMTFESTAVKTAKGLRWTSVIEITEPVVSGSALGELDSFLDGVADALAAAITTQ